MQRHSADRLGQSNSSSAGSSIQAGQGCTIQKTTIEMAQILTMAGSDWLDSFLEEEFWCNDMASTTSESCNTSESSFNSGATTSTIASRKRTIVFPEVCSDSEDEFLSAAHQAKKPTRDLKEALGLPLRSPPASAFGTCCSSRDMLVASAYSTLPRFRTLEQHYLVRRDLMRRFLQALNASDILAMVKLCQEHTNDHVMFISPDIRDASFGRSSLLVLTSLMMEIYPDGVWTVQSEPESISSILAQRNESSLESKVHCRFRFRGSRMSAAPIEEIFKELRGQVSASLMNGSCVDSLLSMARFSMDLGRDISERLAGAEGAAVVQPITVRYQRQANFFFDDDDRIIRIIAFDV